MKVTEKGNEQNPMCEPYNFALFGSVILVGNILVKQNQKPDER